MRKTVISVTLVSTLGCLGQCKKDPESSDNSLETSDEQENGSELCDAYLACTALVEPELLGSLTDSYGIDGSCWGEGEELCNNACEVGLAEYQEDLADDGDIEPDCFEVGWLGASALSPGDYGFQRWTVGVGDFPSGVRGRRAGGYVHDGTRVIHPRPPSARC